MAYLVQRITKIHLAPPPPPPLYRYYAYCPVRILSLGKTLQGPSLVLLKPWKYMNNMGCRRDMTEILLKAA